MQESVAVCVCVFFFYIYGNSYWRSKLLVVMFP